MKTVPGEEVLYFPGVLFGVESMTSCALTLLTEKPAIENNTSRKIKILRFNDDVVGNKYVFLFIFINNFLKIKF